MNLNKLVPRLTIRLKLAIAFALITIAPLVVLAVVTTIGSVRQLRDRARETLEYDLQVAHLSVTREVRQAEQHLSFLAEALLGGVASTSSFDVDPAVQDIASEFLTSDSTAVFRVKVIRASGERVFVGARGGLGATDAFEEETAEFYYLWVAQSALPVERTILPVELRDGRQGTGGVMPAVAIVQAIPGPDGSLRGVVVVEAEASKLFAGLDRNAPGFEGVTGLVDGEGHFLYHSERKRDWTSLIAAQAETTLYMDFPPDVVTTMLSETRGTVRTPNGDIVSFLPVSFGSAGSRPLTLYRSIPATVLGQSVKRFLKITVIVGSIIVVVVLWVAVVAANQFTRPIVTLQKAARTLASGGVPGPMRIKTNDEIEDLAADFSVMAETLTRHREELEHMVAERARALELTQAELAQVVGNAADAVIGLNEAGQVRLWNQGAEALFGYTEGEALEQELDSLIGWEGEEGRREAAFIRHAMETTGGVVGLRTRRTPRDGEPFPVSLTQTVIRDEEGSIAGSSVIIRDDRIQSELEEQMRKSERLGAISIMAAGLAHELNNPLAVIGNRIELMQREARSKPENERLLGDLEVLGQHTNRIKAVTTDLLNFAREEEDAPETIEIAASVERVTRLLEHTFAQAGVALEREEFDRVPPIVGTEKSVETVLANLLINAVQATPSGGSVKVAVRRVGANVDVEVEDTGPGVPRELRNRIFQPFFTTKGNQGGTGLGLAVCRVIMEQHGGSITLHAGERGGSRFVASFPIVVEDA